MAGESLHGQEALKILVVHNHINGVVRGLQVVPPGLESLKNREEFLVMHVIIEFCTGQGVCVESHRADFAIIGPKEEDPCDCLVRCVSFDHWRESRVKMV